MVDYFEATLIDPRTLREAKETRQEKKIADKDVPTITINGRVEKLDDDVPVRKRTAVIISVILHRNFLTRFALRG